MVWVVLIVIFLVYQFISKKREEVSKINKQGGFYIEYKELIDSVLSIPGMEIEKKNSYSITVSNKKGTSYTRFIIGHGFEDVSIFWYHHSIVYGEHKLNWRFKSHEPQQFMIETISREIDTYSYNLMNE